jgi:acyl-CoA thioesterase II
VDGSTVRPPSLPDAPESLWQVEPTSSDRYAGWCQEGALGRVFGGQVAAQALAAAGAALGDGWCPASLHAYFIRGGRSSTPVEYDVVRLGQVDATMCIAHVSASQDGKPIFLLDAALRPCVPTLPPTLGGEDPDGWTPSEPYESRWLAEHSRRGPFELRFVDRPSRMAGRRGEVVDGQRFWFRAADRLPDEWFHHACALVYASDMSLVSMALAVHGLPGRQPEVEAASLDHAVWLHQAARADEWVLFEQQHATSAGGRGLTSGRLVARTGQVVATIRQEVLQRLPS